MSALISAIPILLLIVLMMGFKVSGYRSAIVTLIVTILLWMMDMFTGINTYTVALIPFAVFAIFGIITKYDLDEINWSVIWMVAGGFALGYAMNGSGLAALVVRAIPFGNFSPVLIVVLSGLLCYGLSNLISHSATAALLMPILATVCTGMGDKLGAIGGTNDTCFFQLFHDNIGSTVADCEFTLEKTGRTTLI